MTNLNQTPVFVAQSQSIANPSIIEKKEFATKLEADTCIAKAITGSVEGRSLALKFRAGRISSCKFAGFALNVYQK